MRTKLEKKAYSEIETKIRKEVLDESRLYDDIEERVRAKVEREAEKRIGQERRKMKL